MGAEALCGEAHLLASLKIVISVWAGHVHSCCLGRYCATGDPIVYIPALTQQVQKLDAPIRIAP